MIKTLTFTNDGGNLKINEYPNAALLGEIDGDLVPALRSIALHQHDLECCQQALEDCGELMREHKDKPIPKNPVRVKVMWTGILGLYIKCFTGGVRQKLECDVVFSDPKAREIHHYYKDVRDKHLLHDVNTFSACLAGVVVNPIGTSPKVEAVVSSMFEAFPSPEDMRNVYNLVAGALAYVRTRHEVLQGALRLKYEQRPHEELLRLPKVNWPVPMGAHVTKPRTP